MLGFILISGKNRVLLLDGDEAFKNYLIMRVELEIRQPLEIASTSSGIVTDLVEIPKEPSRKRSKRLNSVRYSMEEASHLLLPMISLYRGSAALGDPIEAITTDGNRVSFKGIANGCLIIYIGRANESKVLVEDYYRSLELNIGPLLDVLENEYCSLKQAKENVTTAVARQIRGDKQFNEAIDIRRTLFHKGSTYKLLPLVRSICTQLQLFLGSNRCLLVCDKSVLLSTHSAGSDKPLTTSLDMRDLHELVSQLASHPTKLKEPETTQVWMRTRTSLVPFYVNVIRYKMANNLCLICLHSTKADRFIRLVVLIIMQIEQLQAGYDLEKIVSEITESVNELTSHLQEFVSDNKENPNDFPFLRNPLRSAQFFKTLWTRLAMDFGKLSEPAPAPKPSKRFSLVSLKSALSSFPLVASTLSLKNNNGKQPQEIPLKTDVQLAQWRKQIVSLLTELCNVAKRDATSYKLQLFNDSMKRIIKPHLEKLIAECSTKMSEAELKYTLFLRPIDMKLDMLGFCLKDSSKGLELSYDNEEMKTDLPQWKCISPSVTHCLDVTGISNKIYTIYKLSGSKNTAKGSALKLFLSSQPPAQLLSPEITITAVFYGYVNKELAARQIQTLVRLLRLHLSEFAHFFY